MRRAMIAVYISQTNQTVFYVKDFKQVESHTSDSFYNKSIRDEEMSALWKSAERPTQLRGRCCMASWTTADQSDQVKRRAITQNPEGTGLLICR